MTVEAIGEVPQWTLGDRMGKALRESDIGVQGMADYLGVGTPVRNAHRIMVCLPGTILSCSQVLTVVRA